MSKDKEHVRFASMPEILKEYETTVYVEEAIHRLVEINYKIGLLDESKRYANLLGYNYASSEWYKKSYKILNKDLYIFFWITRIIY